MRSDSPAAQRVVDAWEHLATRDKRHAAHCGELREIARGLIARKSVEYAEQMHKAAHLLKQLAFELELVEQSLQIDRRLVDDALALRPALKEALQQARRIHAQAAEREAHHQAHRIHAAQREWYQQSALNKEVARRSLAAYECALRALDEDPVLTFLASRPFPSRSRGNPQKKRNSLVRRELRARGLLKREIEAILSAIGFTDRRAVNRRRSA